MTAPPSASLRCAPHFPPPCRGRAGLPSPRGGRDRRALARQGEGGRALALPVALLAALLLTACNLRPIYAGGPQGPAATTLASIEIAPIPDRAGYLVRQQLLQRLQPAERPAYRLEVTLDDKITGFGIRTDTSIARERRTLRARYRLVATASSAVVLDATAATDEGIDVVRSEYAVVAAEQTALDRLAVSLAEQITARIALFAHERGTAAPPPK